MPSTPGGLAIAGSTADSISIGWLGSTDNVGVLAYEVWRDGIRIQVIPANKTTFSDTALVAGRAYVYSVRAMDAAGNASAFSVEINVRTQAAGTTLDSTAPSVPSALILNASGPNSLGISWAPSSDNTGVVRYDVYQGTTLIASTAQTSIVLTSLTAGTSYAITVRAVDATGNLSAPSAVLQVSTAAAAAGTPAVTVPPSPVPTPSPTPTPTPSSTVSMPLEILGAPGTTVAAVVPVSSTSATKLSVKAHRLAWREDGEFAMKFNGSVRPGSKGSVRLNGGPWLGLSNQTVTCNAHEQAYGCLNGTYSTVRFTVQVSALGAPGIQTGNNTLEFRFDATDGVSSGWRVLAFDLQNASGVSTIPPGTFVDENPDTWTPPLNTPADIAAGKALWETAPLTDLGFSNSRHAINGKCGSCHARDAYDLKYFNYSNKSIEVRSVFHGLTATQGKQIASYIRSLDAKLPSGTAIAQAGRPWNPPYQPGPGLDSKPVELWSAGAGLGAVLESDSQMKATMFTGGSYDAAKLGATGFLNPRETPQAIQLVDWNAWLPTLALEDMVSDPSKVVPFAGNTAPPDNQQNPLDMLKVATQWLESYRFTGMESTTEPFFRNHGLFLVHRWGTSKWPNANPGMPGNPFSPSDPVARSRQALAFNAWYAIRMWELMKKYKLEEISSRSGLNVAETVTDPVKGTVNTGSPTRGIPANHRSWPMPHRTLFELAPHFMGPSGPDYEKAIYPGGANFVFSKPGEYLTTAWYSLEQIVNGGWRSGAQGIDWNYHPQHLGGMHRGGTGFYSDGPMHPYRWAWSVIWLYQTRPTDWAPNYFAGCTCGFMQRQIGMGLDVPFMDEAEAAGQLTLADRKQLQEVLALAFLGTVERYTPSQWSRRTVNDAAHLDASNFETVDYVATFNVANSYDLPERGYQADAYYDRIRTLKLRGYLTASTLNRLVDWGATIWPKGTWALLRP